MQQVPYNLDLSRMRDFYNAGIIKSFVVMPSISGRFNLFAIFADGHLASVLTARGRVKEYRTIDTCLREMFNITGQFVPFQFRPQ